MEKTSNNLFLTGKAGTGKSTLLRQFIAHTQKNIAVLAPTGVAALNVWGSTIHSFFQIPPVVTEKTLKKEAKSQIGNPKFTELDAIVIDEISMVRADLFDHINRYLQIVCKNKKPFGGIQMLLIGDLYQLPPVVRRDEAEFFRQTYASPYFFSSNVVTSGKFTFTFLELETVYRQQDQLFLSFLNAIRTKNLTTTTFDQLNQQGVRTDDWEIAPWEMYLAGKNDVVDRINLQKLEELPGEAQLFLGSLDGVMREHSLPTETELWLKVWAQVMFVVNDPKGRWVNGTLGVITDMKHKSLTVQIFGGEEVQVTPHIWKVSLYPLKR